MRSSGEIVGWPGGREPSFTGADPHKYAGMHPDLQVCIRVYPNGSWKVEPRTISEVGPINESAPADAGWFAHQVNYRWGNALFIDGKCVRHGDLDEEHCRWVERRLAEGLPPTDHYRLKNNSGGWGEGSLRSAIERDIYEDADGPWVVIENDQRRAIIARVEGAVLNAASAFIVPGTTCEVIHPKHSLETPDSDFRWKTRYNGVLPKEAA